ncbi:MAG: hypothetical protein R6W66_11550 [Pelovirga sp.]
MDDRRIMVEPRGVELTLSSGLQLHGELFLHLQGTHLSGLQRVEEILNDADSFMPIRSGGNVELINLEQVVCVSLAAAEEIDPLLTLGSEHRIRVEPAVGAPLALRIFVNLPSGRERVKDFLNQPRRFLPFLQEDRLLYLARAWILRVTD